MLTEEQEQIKRYFLSFLFTQDKYLIIDGKGGTGKSYLLCSLIDTLHNDAEDFAKLLGVPLKYNSFAITSTTNKSLSILSRGFNQNNRYFNNLQTIHSFLNLTVKEDYTTGSVYLKPTKAQVIYKNCIIFIDECSMIDGELFKYIDSLTQNCKVIFIGDKCQLPPVKEKLSPIYTMGITEFSLSKVIRTDKQDLLNMNEYLRQCVLNQEKAKIQCSENIIYLDDKKNKTFDWITDNLKDQENNNHICCYSNNEVTEYCNVIGILRGYKAKFNIGQKATVNEPVEEGNKILLPTDSVVTIKDICKTNGVDYMTQMPYMSLLVTSDASTRDIVLNVPIDFELYKGILKQLAKKKDWTSYFLFKKSYADLRLLDVSTVHKAQGSTYNDVLIDLSDLGTCRNPEQFRRLLYVAFSRAKNKVFLTGTLPEKYGEILL